MLCRMNLQREASRQSTGAVPLSTLKLIQWSLWHIVGALNLLHAYSEEVFRLSYSILREHWFLNAWFPT